MNIRRLTLETTLFAVALFLGVVVRFYNLGATPLSDIEAEWALQALQVARPIAADAPLTLGPQPAYVFLTGVLFSLFGTSEFLARFWPALAGCMLVILPILLRRPLGRPTALILAFGLSLDPGLVATSRQVGGPMMALSFGLLALGFWQYRKPIVAGISSGLALLSGPAVIQGVLGIGISWVILRSRREDIHPSLQFEFQKDRRRILITAGITILIIGTNFLRYPQGLPAGFSIFPIYIESWLNPSGIHPLHPVVALLIYQLFPLLFAGVAVVRWLYNRRSPNWIDGDLILFPLTWTIISLVLSLLHPGRQVSDLVWTVVPLWTLAAMELKNYIPTGKPNPVALLETGLVIILGALFWNRLIATNQVAPITELPWLGIRIAILMGIISLGALTTALIALGWSWEASRLGLVWGLTTVFVIYSISALWGATQLRSNQPQELWNQPPGTGQASLFMATLTDFSNWNTGSPKYIDVVSTVETPSIRWNLRDLPNVQFVSIPPVGDMPEVIITREQEQAPALTAAYRGQDFVWWTQPGWAGILPPDTISWLTFREAPLFREHIILWVRADLFPGGTTENQTNSDLEEFNTDIK